MSAIWSSASSIHLISATSCNTFSFLALMFLLLASNNYILVKVTSSDKSEFSLK